MTTNAGGIYEAVILATLHALSHTHLLAPTCMHTRIHAHTH